MALILNIETSTKACSVAIGKNGQLHALKESNPAINPLLLNKGEYIHSDKLSEYIEEVFGKSLTDFNSIDAIAVSKGPGSYTGLRIGVSTAKGLCYALGKPLIAINTLKAMAAGISLQHRFKEKPDMLYCPMLDARRMEVYCAIYDKNLKEVKETAAEIIDENSFSSLLNSNAICFFGEGAEKCKKKIIHKNALFPDDIFPSAIHMIKLSEEAFRRNKFEDIAYFEPFYLKDFVGTVRK